MTAIERYDLVVIGSGPAGEKGAVQAAYFDRTADDEEEGGQTRQGKHAQFTRARDRADEKQLIGIGKIRDKTHFWLCQPAEGDPHEAA